MRKILTSLCLALICLFAMAEDNCNISLASDTILIGGQQTSIALCMDNSKPITLIQADIILPEGVSVAQVDSDMQITTINRADGHTVASNTLDSGKVRFIIMSSTNKAFSGSEGQVASIKLDVNPNIAEGEQEIRLTNILLVQPTEEYYRLSDATINLTAINQETATAILKAKAEGNTGTARYNISGQQARKNEKGVIIQHGKKTAVK